MIKHSKALFGLLIVFVTLPCIAQNQGNNGVVVIPMFGDESTWQGHWVVDRRYHTADIIEEGGSSYIALKSHTSSLASIPPADEFWDLVAASGANGVQGNAGPTGLTGAVGPEGPAGTAGSVVSVDEATIFETIPDSTKPNEKTLSGIVYTAGINLSVSTPDAANPNEKTITFNPSGLTAVPRSPIDIRNPYLGLRYIIALQGIFPSRSGPEPYVAEVVMFGGNFAPRGWAFCDGQLLPISSNTALFSLVGTMYGGDGRSTMALPDLRGRSPIGVGRGPGLSNISQGQKGGAETISPTFNVRPGS